MTRPPHLCACGMRKIPHGERCPCQINATRERNRRHDAQRGSASQRLYGYEWRKARRDYLAAHPYCVMPGCGAPATTVDHIIPHRRDLALFWNRRNWQSLCTRCHNSTKQRMERRR
ncbi:MAG: HNH endonuclease [Aquamicrobium sp.]|nr:HNH endonuclease [Aquamicrobium sp.]